RDADQPRDRRAINNKPHSPRSDLNVVSLPRPHVTRLIGIHVPPEEETCVRYYMRMRNLASLLLAASTLLAQPPSPSPPQNPAASAGQADVVRAHPVRTMRDLMPKIIHPRSDAVVDIATQPPET